MNRSVNFFVTTVTLMLLLTVGAHAQGASDPVELPTEYISVGDYSGTANERINAAIAAAMATGHKTVFFSERHLCPAKRPEFSSRDRYRAAPGRGVAGRCVPDPGHSAS